MGNPAHETLSSVYVELVDIEREIADPTIMDKLEQAKKLIAEARDALAA